MQRRNRGNDSGDDAHRRDEESSQNMQQNRRKRRRHSNAIESVAVPAEPSDDIDAQSTAKSSISILLEPTSSPSTVLNAILDIKRISDFSTSARSIVISSGCIPPLLHRLGVGFNDNDEHILHVVSALCKENSDIRQQFRTPAFIKKAVALAIPALGDLASSGPTAKSARFILKSLSDSSSSDYDNKLLGEQQKRLDDLKEVFFMSQTIPSIAKEPSSDENCDNCSVCLDSLDHDVASGQSSVASSISCHLPCSHGFHKACISKWLQKHASCPVCRHKLDEPPRTPPILSPMPSLPFPLSLLFGLGALGGAGGASISFGLPGSMTPAGMNIVFVSFRSLNAPLDPVEFLESDS